MNIRMKQLMSVCTLFVMAGALLYASSALAQPYLGLEYGRASGLGEDDVQLTVANLIKVVLGLLGILSVSLMVYAGFLWMTSAGNDDQVSKAKAIIFGAVIGLVIIFTAFSITNFVVNSLSDATTGGGDATNQTP